MMLVIRLPWKLDFLGCVLSICMYAMEWPEIRFVKWFAIPIYSFFPAASHSLTLSTQKTDDLMRVRKAITRFIAFCIDLRCTTIHPPPPPSPLLLYTVIFLYSTLSRSLERSSRHNSFCSFHIGHRRRDSKFVWKSIVWFWNKRQYNRNSCCMLRQYFTLSYQRTISSHCCTHKWCF